MQPKLLIPKPLGQEALPNDLNAERFKHRRRNSGKVLRRLPHGENVLTNRRGRPSHRSLIGTERTSPRRNASSQRSHNSFPLATSPYGSFATLLSSPVSVRRDDKDPLAGLLAS